MKKIMNKNNAIESNRYWKTHSGEECDDVSSETGSLKKHLKVHGGQKTNKCNQCGFASSYSSALRRHLKTHSGEKSNKCNQCDFATAEVRALRRHLLRHSGGNQTSVINVTLLLPGQAL